MSIEEIREPVEQELKAVEEEYSSLMESDVRLISDVIRHLKSVKGKRIRSIILLLSSGLSGRITAESIKTAAIVELLHTATLIHDDVVDNSAMRRGAPSINSIWNNKLSILVGDYLFSSVIFSIYALNKSEVTRIIVDVARNMSQGELMQLEYGSDFKLDEATYFDLIKYKTASLISASCELGALTSSASNLDHIETMRRFGENLGIAFQIKDDLLDLMGVEKMLGKPVANDITGKILTLPLIYSLKTSTKKDHDRIIALLENDSKSDHLTELQNFVDENGGIDHATQVAHEYMNRALTYLENYDDSKYRRSLINLSSYILNRDN